MSSYSRLLFALLAMPSLVFAEDLDSGLAKLAANLSATTTKAAVKKISVLDFTDLQGNNNELGRYIAEQLSISLANSSTGFSVMNRANLKSILEEHKLTASGLVNPENARKLGQFSGVDAIAMGTITPFGETLNVTAQLLSTETAQVIGGATIKIARNKDIDELLNSTASPKQTSDGAQQKGFAAGKDFDAPNGTSIFSEISVELTSFRFTDQGSIMAVVKIQNRLNNATVAVGLNSQPRHDLTYLVDEKGQVFGFKSVTGMGVVDVRWGPESEDQFSIIRRYPQFQGQALGLMSEISAGQSIVVTIEFSRQNRSVGSVFRLHSGIIVAVAQRNNSPVLKLDNFLIEGISARQ